MMKLKELLKEEEEWSVRKYDDLRKLNSRLDSYQGVLKAFLGKYPKQGKPSQKGNEKRVIEIIRDIEKIVKQLKDTAND